MWQLHDNTLLFGLCDSGFLDVWSARKLVRYSVSDFKAGVLFCLIVFFKEVY